MAVVAEDGRARHDPAAEMAIGHVKATLVGLYNLDEQWAGRVDAFTRVSDHIGKLTGTDPASNIA